jgi:hypothetical protein
MAWKETSYLFWGAQAASLAVAGSLPATSEDVARSICGDTQGRVSASCRDGQAGSLRSPREKERASAAPQSAEEPTLLRRRDSVGCARLFELWLPVFPRFLVMTNDGLDQRLVPRHRDRLGPPD